MLPCNDHDNSEQETAIFTAREGISSLPSSSITIICQKEEKNGIQSQRYL